MNRHNIPYILTLQDTRDIISERNKDFIDSQELQHQFRRRRSCKEYNKKSQGKDEKDNIGEVRALEDLFQWLLKVLFQLTHYGQRQCASHKRGRDVLRKDVLNPGISLGEGIRENLDQDGSNIILFAQIRCKEKREQCYGCHSRKKKSSGWRSQSG